MTEQLTIDFEAAERDRHLNEMWERNRAAQASQWTDETLAAHWIHCPPEVWAQLPIYERNAITADYVAVRGLGKFPLQPYHRSFNEDLFQQKLEFAKRMAAQLSADWSQNIPPSMFTVDPVVAGIVSLFLGRRVDPIMKDYEITSNFI